MNKLVKAEIIQLIAWIGLIILIVKFTDTFMTGLCMTALAFIYGLGQHQIGHEHGELKSYDSIRLYLQEVHNIDLSDLLDKDMKAKGRRV